MKFSTIAGQLVLLIQALMAIFPDSKIDIASRLAALRFQKYFLQHILRKV